MKKKICIYKHILKKNVNYFIIKYLWFMFKKYKKTVGNNPTVLLINN